MPKRDYVCAHCDATFQRYPSTVRGRRVFCSRRCTGRAQMGPKNPDWKGGRYVEPGKGYILLRMPKHHRARKNGYVLEHIVAMEEKLGRRLRLGEVVHHLNRDQADNRPENLAVYASNGEHLRQEGHHRKRQPPCPCGRPAVARRLCSRHYAQHRRTGRIWDLG